MYDATLKWPKQHQICRKIRAIKASAFKIPYQFWLWAYTTSIWINCINLFSQLISAMYQGCKQAN